MRIKVVINLRPEWWQCRRQHWHLNQPKAKPFKYFFSLRIFYIQAQTQLSTGKHFKSERRTTFIQVIFFCIFDALKDPNGNSLVGKFSMKLSSWISGFLKNGAKAIATWIMLIRLHLEKSKIAIKCQRKCITIGGRRTIRTQSFKEETSDIFPSFREPTTLMDWDMRKST